MTISTKKLTFSVNPTPQEIESSLNAFLASTNPITITEIRPFKDTSEGYSSQIIQILYRDPGSSSYAAEVFVGDTTSSASDKANAAFAANPDRRAYSIVDITPGLARSLITDAILVIYNDEIEADCSILNDRPRLVSPDADILSGATGLASLITKTGTDATKKITVRNRADFTWATGEEGWAILSVVDCAWDGFPTCCSAPPP